jgi:hypothetical protein
VDKINSILIVVRGLSRVSVCVAYLKPRNYNIAIHQLRQQFLRASNDVRFHTAMKLGISLVLGVWVIIRF